MMTIGGPTKRIWSRYSSHVKVASRHFFPQTSLHGSPHDTHDKASNMSGFTPRAKSPGKYYPPHIRYSF